MDIDDIDDLAEAFQQDKAVQEALLKGTDLASTRSRPRRRRPSSATRSRTTSRACASGAAHADPLVRHRPRLMESMLRGFQTDLASISAQIKFLQDESPRRT